MKKIFRKFILWYMKKVEHGSFSDDEYIVRVISGEWYDEHLQKAKESSQDMTQAIELLEKSVEIIEYLLPNEVLLTNKIKKFISEVREKKC